MAAKVKRDWGLIVAGVLLVVGAVAVGVMPRTTLVVAALSAGALFFVSGIADLVSYLRIRKQVDSSWWSAVYAALDILIGLALLLHPVVLSVVLPWIVGALFIIFGLVEVVAAVRARAVGFGPWAWMLVSGLAGFLCGLAFIVWPAMLSLIVAAFMLLRGVSLVVYGTTAGKVIP